MGHTGSSEPARELPEGPRGPQGRRERKARATRLALFRAGLAAFEHRPLAVVSVLDLTEACDVAKGVFYLHFRGKDEYLIALWEHVQASFLAAAAERAATARSRAARVEAAAAYAFGRIAESPRECRFWLRMASYFGDEIGEPGRMQHLRAEYLRRLAGLLAGAPPETVGEADLRLAGAFDGTSWGLVSRALQGGTSALDEAAFVRAVGAALRALAR